jgi:myo-inositol-1(or 4)-monophosphatase
MFLDIMREAAVAAGEGLIRNRARLDELTVHDKLGPADVFTEADVAAEQTVREILMRAQPRFGFLGEEGGLEPGSDPDHVWIVDPLDGTTNFLTGTPLFAVNIALARAGQVIAGVTYAPALDEMFHAESGGGAFLNGRQIRISARDNLGQAVLGVGIPFATKPHHDRFLTEMERLTTKVAGVRRLGAGALDMAWVACGRFDAYWEQDTSAWDMAAGAVIVREAGGVVTGTCGGKLDLMGRTVLAATPAIHGQLVEALTPAG